MTEQTIRSAHRVHGLKDLQKSDITASGTTATRHLADFLNAMQDDGASWTSMSVFDP